MKRFGLLLLILFGGAFGALLSGCGDDEPTQQTEEKAAVKIFHVATGVQGVDLQFNTTKFASNRMFGDFTTYLSTPAGSTEIKLLSTGTTTALASKTVTFEKDKKYSLFAVADLEGIADLVVFNDDLTTPAAGKAHIRVAHMIPDGPAIKAAIMSKGPFAENVAFKANSETFTAVDAGTVTLRIQDNAVAGGGSGGSPPLLEKSVLLEEGKIYTLIAQGKISNSTAELILIEHSAN